MSERAFCSLVADTRTAILFIEKILRLFRGIFRVNVQHFLEHKTLTHMSTAFSRDSENKIYVQHKMEEQGSMIADLMLNENAIFFMCG
jgi:hypothetical protein